MPPLRSERQPRFAARGVAALPVEQRPDACPHIAESIVPGSRFAPSARRTSIAGILGRGRKEQLGRFDEVGLAPPVLQHAVGRGHVALHRLGKALEQRAAPASAGRQLARTGKRKLEQGARRQHRQAGPQLIGLAFGTQQIELAVRQEAPQPNIPGRRDAVEQLPFAEAGGGERLQRAGRQALAAIQASRGIDGRALPVLRHANGPTRARIDAERAAGPNAARMQAALSIERYGDPVGAVPACHALPLWNNAPSASCAQNSLTNSPMSAPSSL